MGRSQSVYSYGQRMQLSAEFITRRRRLVLAIDVIFETRNVGQCPTWWSPCRI